MVCDTRDYEVRNDEIFIAPLGMMSTPVERAIRYLKIVTLMNEIENKEFDVWEVIKAIERINVRYAKRTIQSQSVSTEKAWSERDPHWRGYEATTTKKLVCVNSKLSLPNGGDWIQVCYLPKEAFSTNPS